MKIHRTKILPLALALAGLGFSLPALQEAKGAGFVTVNPMKRARNFHSATLLPNGKVLVAGGFPTGSSAELYDPATGTWTLTGSLRRARVFHDATLLPNGKVLIAGSLQDGGGGQGTTSAELYDPATGTWALTGSMKRARSGAPPVLLPDGKVLVVDGGTASEIYNPATGTWTDTSPTSAGGAPPVLLLNGKVLAGAELYDPATGMWTPTGVPSNRYLTATLLLNGKVLAAGGSRMLTAELYDPESGTWSATGSLTWDRDFCRATLLRNGHVLITGGLQRPDDIPIPSAELYDPESGTWTEIAMNEAHFSHTATLLPNGNVLVAGGNDYPPLRVLASAEIYDWASDAPPVLTILRNANQTVSLSWTGAGTLEQTASLISHDWQPAPSQANPQAFKAAEPTGFFRVKVE